MAQVGTLDGNDITNSVPLDSLHIEESIDSRAICSFTIEDFANSINVFDRSDVKWTDGGSTVFRGTVLTRKYVQKVGYRDIEVTCSDYSIVFDERIVGAPSGQIYVGPDAQGNYESNDPDARTTSDDATTVQWLIGRYVGGIAINTSTYVTPYLPVGYLGDHPMYWKAVTLRSALQDVAAVAGPDVHFWLDPDLNFHWQALPISATTGGVDTGGSLPLLMPLAPALTASSVGIAESALVDYSTFYEADDPPGLQVTYDGTSFPQQVYITGTTDFINTPSGNITITLPVAGGTPITLLEHVPIVQGGGTGWYPFTDAQGEQARDSSKRQAVVPSDASTLAERAADGATAIRYASRALIRGQATVTSASLIFHAGNTIHIKFPTALGIDDTYIIQKVDTQYLNGTGTRQHVLDWGDAPTGRLTQKRPPKTIANLHAILPATQLEIGTQDVNPKPGSVQDIVVKVSAPDGVTVSKQFNHLIQLQLFYFRAGVLLNPSGVFTGTALATIFPTTVTFIQQGYVFVEITYDSTAQDGDVAFVAAYMQDTP